MKEKLTKTELTRAQIMVETTRVLALRELADDRSKTAQANVEIEQARAGGPFRPLPGTWILNDSARRGRPDHVPRLHPHPGR